MMLALSLSLGAILLTGGEAVPTPPSDPVNTDAPILTYNGTDLFVTDGTWGGSTPMTPSYAWELDAGAGFSPVVGETSNTVAGAQPGVTWRAIVTMVNETAVPVSAYSNTLSP